jgi:hypothetical protein
MSCQFEGDLNGYVLGTATEAQTRATTAHLLGCAECRTVEQLIRSTLRPMESDELSGSEAAREAVLRSMEEQTSLLYQLGHFFRRKDGKK